MAFDINKLKNKVTEAKAAEAKAAWEPIKSGIYEATITLAGTYTNTFDSDAFVVTVEVEKDGSEPAKLKMDRGLTLRDGGDNKSTLSLIKEILAATGVELTEENIGEGVIQSWNTKEHKMTDFKVDTFTPCAGKKVSVFIRETFEEGAKMERGNIIEDIFKLDRTNSDGKDQSETFLAKITKEPVLKRKSKAKAGGAAVGAGSASKPSTDAGSKL